MLFYCNIILACFPLSALPVKGFGILQLYGKSSKAVLRGFLGGFSIVFITVSDPDHNLSDCAYGGAASVLLVLHFREEREIGASGRAR
jgi:hypothetical protein